MRWGKRFAHGHLVYLFLFALLFSCLSSCSDEPILIGFSGTLKGKFSDLGVQGRNGAILAVEDINSSGGIDGRKLQLLIQDDGNTPEGAVSADRKMIDEGVSAIIGHMTSAQSIAALSEFSGSEVVFISPTTSTNVIQGVRDNFFRVIPTLTDLADSLAVYATEELNLGRVAIVWDLFNRPFTEPYKDAFIKKFREKGGKVVGEVDFSTEADARVQWKPIIEKLKKLNPDSVVAVTSARDLALFAQHCRLEETGWVIMSSMWGYTRELIQTGGKSVEGVLFAVHFSEDNPELAYRDFKKRFQGRFGWEPNFAAAFGYEAVRVFAEAVRKNGGRTDGLADVIPGMSFDSGLMGAFSIDEYGDVKRKGNVVTVRDGEFVTVSRGVK